MKHGKNLTKKQKIFVSNKQINPEEWLLERDTSEKMVLISKVGNKKIEIHKGA